MDRLWLGLGSLLGLTGVMMAALAAHALPGRIAPAALALVHTAIEMQMWHALALLGCGVLARIGAGRRRVMVAGGAFALGTLLFCGAVYTLTIAGVATGPVAPIGGTLLMLGWLLLGASALRR